MGEQRPASAPGADGAPMDIATHDEFMSRIGHMTRALHDSLRGLGLDKLIEKAASDIPDARDRLDYVARLSEQAAQKVLNATDAAGPLQDRIEADAGAAAKSLEAMLAAPDASAAEWRSAVAQALATLQQSSAGATRTKAYLMDIMMAQDFQDLTGQVITKVTAIAQNLEQQLVQMLVDFAPADVKREYDNGLMNGPQIHPTGNNDVVSSQGQVDDLLDSLGF